MTRFPSRAYAAVSGVIRGRSVVLSALAVLLMAVPATAQFSVQPVIVELRPAGVEGAETLLTLRNDGDEPLQLRVYASDFDQPEEGGHTFLEAGTHERSCADRLTFVPDNLVLGGRGAGEVRVRMEEGEETCWSLIFVQSVTRGASGIRVAQRIGVKVYGVSPAASLEGEIREVRVTRGAGGELEVELAFSNLGATPVRPEGEIEVRSVSGEVVAVVPVAPFSVLPGRTLRTQIPLELSLSDGVYVLVPILDFGGEYLAGGQAVVQVGDG